MNSISILMPPNRRDEVTRALYWAFGDLIDAERALQSGRNIHAEVQEMLAAGDVVKPTTREQALANALAAVALAIDACEAEGN